MHWKADKEEDTVDKYPWQYQAPPPVKPYSYNYPPRREERYYDESRPRGEYYSFLKKDWFDRIYDAFWMSVVGGYAIAILIGLGIMGFALYRFLERIFL